MKTVSYIVVAYRSRSTITALLYSIESQIGDFQREIIVVDNSPHDNCADLIQNRPVKYILNQRNTGYTCAINQAIVLASGEYLFLLNPDVRLQPHCTVELLNSLAADNSAAAAPQLLNDDDSIQYSVRNFPNFATLCYDATALSSLFPNSRTFGRWRNRYFDHSTASAIEQPMASALMIRREVVTRLGPLDERFFVFFSDVDYCKRMIEAGYKILFVPAAQAHHKIGGSTRQEGAWLIRDSHRGFYCYLVKHELNGAKTVLRPLAAAMLAVGAVIRMFWRKIAGKSF